MIITISQEVVIEKKKLYDAIGYEGDDTSISSYPEEVSF